MKYEQDLAELEQKRREFEAEKQEFEARIEAEKVTSGRANAASSAHAGPPTSAHPPPVKVKKDKLGKLFQKSRVSLDSHSQSSDEGIKGQKTPKHSRFPKF